MHTVHSDGELTVHELACWRRPAGWTCWHHNTVSHHGELPAAARHAGCCCFRDKS